MTDAEKLWPHYRLGRERDRLLRDGEPRLEFVRTLEILGRYLPEPPARVLDIGGGAGAYAGVLARSGYTVHLVEPLELHVEQAVEAAAAQPDAPFTVALGDARGLAERDGSQDVVLLMGPLYHLTERAERLEALLEARRVLRDGGVLVAVGISRYRSLLGGLVDGDLHDGYFAPIVERDLREGQHRNPDPDGHPERFTSAYFHRPQDLKEEAEAAGFRVEELLGIEGPGWLFEHRWGDQQQRTNILSAARAVESVAEMLGVSTHLAVIGRR